MSKIGEALGLGFPCKMEERIQVEKRLEKRMKGECCKWIMGIEERVQKLEREGVMG